MFKVLFNSMIGTSPQSLLLDRPVIDVGEYGAIETTGLTSGHQGCAGCGMLSGTNQVLRALKLTGKFILASIGTGCNEVVTTQNTTCWGEGVSVDHNNFPNTAATLSGHIAATHALIKAGLVSDGAVVNLGMAGDGGTYDIGLQALLGWIARGEDGVYVCLNNEAYMNTGVQCSGATPYGVRTTTTPFGKIGRGNPRRPQHLPDVALAAGAPYVAVATPLHHRDLMLKLQKAALIKGPCVIEIYSVCPEGWKSETDVFHEVTDVALQTGILILYEAELDQDHGWAVFTLNHAPSRFVPVEEYFTLQGRFRPMLNFPQMVKSAERFVRNRWAFWKGVLNHNGRRGIE